MELGRGLLVGLERHRHPHERRVGVVEHVLARRAEHPAELVGVGRRPQPRDHRGAVGIGHLVGIHQRHQRLVVRGVDAAVPRAAAGRALVVDAERHLRLEEVLRERDRRVRVAQRRRVSQARPVEVRTTQLHGAVVRRAEGPGRFVAARARLPARGRIRRIHEDAAAEVAQLRHRRPVAVHQREVRLRAGRLGRVARARLRESHDRQQARDRHAGDRERVQHTPRARGTRGHRFSGGGARSSARTAAACPQRAAARPPVPAPPTPAARWTVRWRRS